MKCFLIFFCEANRLENHARDITSCQGGVFKTFISGKYCTETNTIQWTQIDSRNFSFSFFSYIWGLGVYFGCSRGILVTYLGVWGYFGLYCNALALFPASDPGAMWVSNSPIFIRPQLSLLPLHLCLLYTKLSVQNLPEIALARFWHAAHL